MDKKSRLIFCLVWVVWFLASNSNPVTAGQQFRVVENMGSRITLEWTAPEVEWEHITINGDQFLLPRAGELPLLQREGLPQIPVDSYSFHNRQKIAQIVVKDSLWTELKIGPLCPSPFWKMRTDSLMAAEYVYGEPNYPYPARFVESHSATAGQISLNRIGIMPIKVVGENRVHLLRHAVVEIQLAKPPATRIAASMPMAGEGIKLLTLGEGVYSITAGDVEGFDSFAHEDIAVTNRGNPVPFAVSGNGDRILFFGERLSGDSTYFHAYSDTNAYWIARGNGLRFRKSDPALVAAPELIEQVQHKIHFEEDHDYYHGDNDNEIHETFDSPGEGWVWNKSMFPGSLFRAYFDLPGLEQQSDSVYLTVRLRGTAKWPTPPNHHAQIRVNDNVVRDIYFYNNENVVQRIGLAAALFAGEGNKLEIQSVPIPDVVISKFYVDWYEIEYQRRLEAVDGYLRFRPQAAGRFAASGFISDSVQIWDVANARILAHEKTDRRKTMRFRVSSAGFNDGNYAAFYMEGKRVFSGTRGVTLVAFDYQSGAQLAARTFDTYQSADQSDSLTVFVAGMPDSTLVLSAVRDEGSVNLTQSARQALALLGSKKISDLGVRDSWALIGRKGAAQALAEAYSPAGSGPAEVTAAVTFSQGGDSWTVEFVLDSASAASDIVLFDDRAVMPVNRVAKPSDNDLLSTANGADYLVVTHPFFREAADELASYRNSHNGLRTRVMTVSDIYDQFNFGIADPLAIKRFVKYAVENWQAPAPEFLLLFGDASWDPRQNIVNADKTDFVPTLGNPVSDALFACLDGPEDILPDLSVGRIPVETAEQASAFVEKLRAYESAPSAAWKKRFLFINGGFDRFEQATFRQQSEILARDFVLPPPVSGEVNMINKESQGFEEGEKREDILDAFSEGNLWVNFIGHAGSRTWDLMFHNPDINDLNNAPALPVITSMTCHTGRFAEPNQTSFGEGFLLVPENGAIAFWGTSGWGYTYEDYMYLRRLFPTVMQDTVFTLGTAITLAKQKLWESFGPIPHIRDLILQYNLLGDPATRLALPEKPDLVLTPGSLTTDPVLPVESDSLATIKVRAENWGLASADSVQLALFAEHSRNGKMTIGEQLFFPPLGLRDSLLVPWPLKAMSGSVTLSGELDPENKIAEADESNNRSATNVTVLSSVISVSSPVKDQQVPAARVVLRIENPTALDGDQGEIEFQLSESPSFDDDLLEASGPVQPGPVSTWWSPGELESDKLYYWRVRSIAPSGADPWTTSWFWTGRQFGWKQARGDQFVLNAQRSIGTDSSSAHLAAEQTVFYVESAGYNDGDFARVIVNGTPFVDPSRGINVAVFDNRTFEPDTIALFDTYRDSTAAENLADLIEGLPAGYIVCAAVKDEASRLLSQRAREALASIGSREIFNLGTRDSWAIIGRKGASAGTVPETITTSGTGPAVVADTLFLYSTGGEMTTAAIGPTEKWGSLTYDTEIPPETDLRIVLLGHNRQTAMTDTLFTLTGESAEQDISGINAAIYPTLSLKAVMNTSVRTESPRLNSWAVTYEPVADLAVSPQTFRQSADSLLVGETATFELDVYNIGQAPVDSFDVVLTGPEDNSGQAIVDRKSIKRTVAPDSAATVKFTFETAGKRGPQKLFVAVDPDFKIPELSEANNSLVASLFVIADTVRPQIEITFDDLPVAYGELVSATPLIRAVVLDNSPAAIVDTSKIRVLLDGKQISFSDPEQLRLADASYPQNAVIEFRPQLSDGEHVLEIFVTDASGNAVYQRADFRVVSELSLINILNYPNPMKNQTQFTFTLTQPAEVDLRIFTVAGRLIRQLELGYCNAGYNVHDWDGLDQDGDRIANGVYLYIAHARSGGKTVQASNKLIVMQ